MAGMQEAHYRKNLAIMGPLLLLAYSAPPGKTGAEMG
jgi:hypothetical protein